MPELAAIYLIGILTELALLGYFSLSNSRRQQRGPAAILRANLARVGVYWSENTERIRAGSMEDEQNDRKSALKTILITGSLLALLSWLGALFLLILMISHRHLARSRLERELFSSRLAQEPDLRTEEVRELIVPYLTSEPLSPAPEDHPPESSAADPKP